MELAKGRIFKWNCVIFAAKIWTRKLFISCSKTFMCLLWPCRVLALNFLLKQWKEVFVVQVVLVLSLQATLKLSETNLQFSLDLLTLFNGTEAFKMEFILFRKDSIERLTFYEVMKFWNFMNFMKYEALWFEI